MAGADLASTGAPSGVEGGMQLAAAATAAAAKVHEAGTPSLEPPATATATPASTASAAALGPGPTAVGLSTPAGEGAGATGVAADGLSTEHGSRSASTAAARPATAATPFASTGGAQGTAGTLPKPGMERVASAGTAHTNGLEGRAGPGAAGRQTLPAAEPRPAELAAVPTPAHTSCWHRTRRKTSSAAGDGGRTISGNGERALPGASGGGGKGEERPGQQAGIVLRIEAASPRETLIVNWLLLLAVAIGLVLACVDRANPQRCGAVQLRAHAHGDGHAACGSSRRKQALWLWPP